jgi:hypothetical protein
MGSPQEIRGFKIPRGVVIEICDGVVCRKYRIRSARQTRRGPVSKLAEVAGSLAIDPMIALYDQLVRDGVERKRPR